MKVAWKRVAALLVMCLLLVPLCAGSVLAVDTDRKCSLVILIQTENGYTDLADADVVADFYLVANAVPGAGDSYDLQLTAPFKDLDLTGFAAGELDWDAADREAARIAFEGSVEPVRTSARPLERQYELAAGMYLVVLRGENLEDYVTVVEREYLNEETGEVEYIEEYATIARDFYNGYMFSPQLVVIPYRGLMMDEDGNWYPADDWTYDGESVFKADPWERAMKKIILHKEDENGNRLPYAKFKLYATRLADPDHAEIGDTLVTYVEGIGYVTLFCQGIYTTDRNGDIIISDPLMDDTTLYAWVEYEAPAGYELDPEPHFFFSYGMWVDHSDYASYLNEPGYLDTQLRYDPESPTDTGSVWIERNIVGNDQRIAFTNAEDGQPAYIRVYVYGSDEGELDGQSFGTFSPTIDGEGWTRGDGGYYYYDEILYPGQRTTELRVSVNGDEVTDGEGNPLRISFRTPIVYDFTPVLQDENGNPYADWSWDPMNPQNWTEGFSSILRPMAEAKGGGYIVGLAADVKSSGRAYWVESFIYDRDARDTDKWNGMTVTNKKKTETPPEEPGTTLPETGGMGTVAFVVGGGGLVAISLFLLFKKKYRRAA